MELEDILAELVDSVDGALVAAVGGMDGLLVEQYPSAQRDLNAATAEVTNLLNTAATTLGDHLDGGAVQELVFTGERLIGYVRVLDPDFFCVLVMNPAGNVGKARLFSEQAGQRVLGAFA